MPTPFQLVLGVAVLVGLGVLFVFGRRLAGAFLRYRGTRVVVCPENREMVAVQVDAGHAALSAPQGRPELRLESCTRWPEKAGCGQECLGQIESAPQACLLRNILGDWYQGKSCAFCGRSVPRDPLARPRARPRRARREDRGLGRLPGGAGRGRAGDPQAGLLGLPGGRELPARAPRARDRPPAAAGAAALDGLSPRARPERGGARGIYPSVSVSVSMSVSVSEGPD